MPANPDQANPVNDSPDPGKIAFRIAGSGCLGSFLGAVVPPVVFYLTTRQAHLGDEMDGLAIIAIFLLGSFCGGILGLAISSVLSLRRPYPKTAGALCLLFAFLLAGLLISVYRALHLTPANFSLQTSTGLLASATFLGVTGFALFLLNYGLKLRRLQPPSEK